MWDEGPGTGTSGLSSWDSATIVDAQEIIRQAKRYCPILPFEPALTEVYEKKVAFYQDYNLVRLAPARSQSVDQELYGFYAPGDFRPLDAEGKAFESLNAKAPLVLTFKTVLDYALLRLRFELSSTVIPQESTVPYRLAEVIRTVDDLHFEKSEANYARLSKLRRLIADPEIEMIKEWDPYADEISMEILRGRAYRVSAIMMVYVSDSEVKLMQVLVQIDPLGTPIIRTDTKGSETFTISGNVSPTVALPRHATSAVAVQDWEHVSESEFEQLRPKLVEFGAPVFWLLTPPDLVLRKCTLSFYKRYRLLEILRWDVNHYQRSYALYRVNNDEIVVHALNGKSDTIHSINREDEELNLTETVVDNYLRFFCWAVRGDAGPFYIPRTFREIPIRGNVSGVDQGRIKELDFSILPVDIAEPTDHNYDQVPTAKFRCYAIVAYEQSLFEAWFAIEPTGMVHMVEDRHLAQVPLQAEENEEFLLPPAEKPFPVTPAFALSESQRSLSLPQRVWLLEALTELKDLCLTLGAEETSVEKLRQQLVRFRGQPFVSSLEKLWPLLPQNASAGSTDLLKALWTLPASRSIVPKDVAAQLPSLIEQLLPPSQTADPDSLSWDQPTITSLLLDQPIVLSTALLDADKEPHHDQAK